MTDYAEQFRAAQAAERRYPNWFTVTAEINFDTLLPTTTRHALQIGAFTGDASLAILTRCPGAHLTDVDTWTGSPAEPVHSAFDWEDVFATYRRRTAPYADRLIVHRTTSDAFFQSQPTAPTYDFIYIDGSHETAQVARDADNAHARLSPHGILAFDDYLWGSPDYANAPRPAIDAFHAAHRDQYDVLAINAQVWLRRRARA